MRVLRDRRGVHPRAPAELAPNLRRTFLPIHVRTKPSSDEAEHRSIPDRKETRTDEVLPKRYTCTRRLPAFSITVALRVHAQPSTDANGLADALLTSPVGSGLL